MNTAALSSNTISTTRYKAAAAHLLICTLVATSVVALLWYFWFPGLFFEASGGRELLLILVGVDVIAGPLLTLIVFDANKKGIKFDMMFIASLQIAALAYGLHIMYVARPVYIVYNSDRFDVVTADQIKPEDMEKAKDPELRLLPLTGPRLMAAPRPTDPEENETLKSLELNGKDVAHMPQYYVEYTDPVARKQALKYTKPVSALDKTSAGLERKLQEIATRRGTTQDNLVYLPVYAIRGDLAAILEKQSGDLLEIVVTSGSQI
ncbi:MAG: TfpX/TfpZ family type IV pilin accessory protein [Burkholderiales bacterium]